MKKVLLLLVFMFMCFSSNAQKITKEFLTGEWESETVLLNFKVDDKKNLYIAGVSILTGNDFKIIGYQFRKKNFYLKMLHEPNNWDSLAKFIIIDENTMVADYVSDAPNQMIYKRKLNN
jgi:hypothetical protein